MIGILGSLAFDYIFDFPGKFSDHILPDKIHEINLSFIVDKFKRQFGGTAGNMAYNLSLLKIPSMVFGHVGEDFGLYHSHLKKMGINTDYLILEKDENSALGFALNDYHNNQIWGYCYGALRHTRAQSLYRVKNKIDLLVISATYPKVFLEFTKKAQELKIPYLYDFGMIMTAISKKDLVSGARKAKIIVGNDYEMALLRKKTDLTKKELLKTSQLIITTLGEKGSVIETKSRLIKIKAAKPKKVIDPTGAGDAYRAGFLAGYLKKRGLEVCGKMAAVAAVYAVEKYGTQNHKYTKEEFKKRYYNNFREKINF